MFYLFFPDALGHKSAHRSKLYFIDQLLVPDILLFIAFMCYFVIYYGLVVIDYSKRWQM